MGNSNSCKITLRESDLAQWCGEERTGPHDGCQRASAAGSCSPEVCCKFNRGTRLARLNGSLEEKHKAAARTGRRLGNDGLQREIVQMGNGKRMEVAALDTHF